jgi:hypothetical protein
MAGTMPHAVFVETGLDAEGSVAAYAAELPGCAVFARTDADAVAAMPHRVLDFLRWLAEAGERAPMVVGDNWYEVERAPAVDGRRAAFSLDELPPSDDEFTMWIRWLELAREELADALDGAGDEAVLGVRDRLEAVSQQDATFATQLGSSSTGSEDVPSSEDVPDSEDTPADVVDRLYATRDELSTALEGAGSTADGVRRILRLAIADDLRVAADIRGASV